MCAKEAVIRIMYISKFKQSDGKGTHFTGRPLSSRVWMCMTAKAIERRPLLPSVPGNPAFHFRRHEKALPLATGAHGKDCLNQTSVASPTHF
jgi:hypothetical protein